MKKLVLVTAFLGSLIALNAQEHDAKKSMKKHSHQMMRKMHKEPKTIKGNGWTAEKVGKNYIVSIDIGEEIIATLEDFVKHENIGSGEISGIGASDYVELKLYDLSKEEAFSKTFEEPMELTNASGNISYKGDELYIHLHVTLGNKDFQAYAGHLVEGRIYGAGEFFIRTEPIKVYKTEERKGLFTYDFEQTEKIKP